MKMVTYYNRGDMVSFGRYLLSKERKEAFELTQDEATTPLEDRLSDVHADDHDKWILWKKDN